MNKNDRDLVRTIISEFFSEETSRLHDVFKRFDEIMDVDFLRDMRCLFRKSFADLNDVASRRLSEKLTASKMCDRVKKERDCYDKTSKEDYIFYNGDTDNPRNNMSKRLSGAAYKILGDPGNRFCDAVKRVQKREMDEQKRERDNDSYLTKIDELAKRVSRNIRTSKELSKKGKEVETLRYKLKLLISLLFGEEFGRVFYGSDEDFFVHDFSDEEEKFFKDHHECKFEKSPFLIPVQYYEKSVTINEKNGKTKDWSFEVGTNNFEISVRLSGGIGKKPVESEPTIKAVVKMKHPGSLIEMKNAPETISIQPWMRLYDMAQIPLTINSTRG